MKASSLGKNQRNQAKISSPKTILSEQNKNGIGFSGYYDHNAILPNKNDQYLRSLRRQDQDRLEIKSANSSPKIIFSKQNTSVTVFNNTNGRVAKNPKVKTIFSTEIAQRSIALRNTDSRVRRTRSFSIQMDLSLGPFAGSFRATANSNQSKETATPKMEHDANFSLTCPDLSKLSKFGQAWTIWTDSSANVSAGTPTQQKLSQDNTTAVQVIAVHSAESSTSHITSDSISNHEFTFTPLTKTSAKIMTSTSLSEFPAIRLLVMYKYITNNILVLYPQTYSQIYSQVSDPYLSAFVRDYHHGEQPILATTANSKVLTISIEHSRQCDFPNCDRTAFPQGNNNHGRPGVNIKYSEINISPQQHGPIPDTSAKRLNVYLPFINAH